MWWHCGSEKSEEHGAHINLGTKNEKETAQGARRRDSTARSDLCLRDTLGEPWDTRHPERSQHQHQCHRVLPTKTIRQGIRPIYQVRRAEPRQTREVRWTLSQGAKHEANNGKQMQ